VIHVPRGRVAIPADLHGPGSKGGKEQANNRKVHKAQCATKGTKAPGSKSRKKKGKKPQTKSFTFSAYKSKSVLDALTELFGPKCAYCESLIGAVLPTDIEHYRPKGGVAGRKGLLTPGYWWLAADWDNLLPSCIDCNRERTQDFPNMPRGLSGKANKFPLHKDSPRARRPRADRRETPLLLNPCQDEPSRHLQFVAECGKSVVRAKKPKKGKPAMGQPSIDVYGLNRKGLVEARTAALVLLRDIERLAITAAEAYDAATGADAQRWFVQLQGHIDLFKTFTDAKKPYAAMARTYIAEVFQKLGVEIVTQ
jgi:uncharacterized protein (TIGR02646 family)